jgi:hypothetical protein
MRIIVSRSGGVTGIAVRWVVELSEGPEYSDWIVLIEACPWDDEPDDPPAPDRFLYLIRVNGRRVTLPEQRVQGPWRELVDRVRATSTPERGRALQPLDTAEPEGPGTPEDRGAPEDPGTPDHPGAPEDPGTPEDPGAPEEPGKPDAD